MLARHRRVNSSVDNNSDYFLIVFSGTNNQRSDMECHQHDRRLLKKDVENVDKEAE